MDEERQNKRYGNSETTHTGRWELAALLAAVAILLSPFLYYFRSDHSITVSVDNENHFVGSKACSQCHQAVYSKWQGSHHDMAMAEATARTVLGDFDNSVYVDPNTSVASRFFRKDEKFYVETEVQDGQRSTFEVTHTFGVYPLQQYLSPFPGGRLQCFNIAWDVQKKRWYRLPPYEINGPDDWLHWTNGGQTWNAMCAECHSTKLHKGYDPQLNVYTTTWYEINVGCEACHGPGSKHAEWAKRPSLGRQAVDNYALTVDTGGTAARKQITLCAPCHSRRFQLGDNDHSQGELLDKMVPSLLAEGLYFADGQIQEEVYVYGSFTQSKMYQKGVRCSDCHDMHSLSVHGENNALCLQCHRADEYDTPTHHFHKREHQGKPSHGYLCVKCHMPGRTYMGIDYRPDHSLRIPRPDISSAIGTPNSCSTKECHGDKSLEWVTRSFVQWYGEKRKPHYGEVFFQARARKQGSGAALRKLAADGLLPVIVRATAVSLLRNYPGPDTTDILIQALQASDALLRYTALRNLGHLDQEQKLRLIAPKLYDKVKAVRIEAAVSLASVPESAMRPDDVPTFRRSLEEYRNVMVYNADFAPQRYNLGNLASAQGRQEEAKSYYQQAITIDQQFYPAKVNLAMLYNSAGESSKAEELLREVVASNSSLYEISYSLGLLLAEHGKYSEAVTYLGEAADGMPGYSRARYNQALALMKLQRWEESEQTLLQALEQDSANSEYFITLVNLYLQLNERSRARELAQKIVERHPGHPEAKKILRLFEQN